MKLSQICTAILGFLAFLALVPFFAMASIILWMEFWGMVFQL